MLEIPEESSANGAPGGAESPAVSGHSDTVPVTLCEELGFVAKHIGGGHYVLIDLGDAHLLKSRSWLPKAGRNTHYAQYTKGPRAARKVVLLHRVITGARPGEVVDHINGNGLDNRRSNLRVTTARGNSMNVTRSKNQSRGGYKGVSWHKKAGKWEAGICAGPMRDCGKRRRIYLGLFEDAAEAARAYDAAAVKYFGEFASLNFPTLALAAESLGVRAREAS